MAIVQTPVLYPSSEILCTNIAQLNTRKKYDKQVFLVIEQTNKG